MIISITEKLLYIFNSGQALMISLACVGVCAFYFAFLVIFSIYGMRGKKINKSIISSALNNIKILKVLASCSPLLGLLGTVIGIGECIASAQDTKALSDGISYALLTTQTGLIIAIPAWIVAILLSKSLAKIQLEVHE